MLRPRSPLAAALLDSCCPKVSATGNSKVTMTMQRVEESYFGDIWQDALKQYCEVTGIDLAHKTLHKSIQ